MKRILIAHEKYGDRYFDASTEEDLSDACVKLLKSRLKDDWGYEPEKPEAKDILSEKEILKLPERFRDGELKRLKRF